MGGGGGGGCNRSVDSAVSELARYLAGFCVAVRAETCIGEGDVDQGHPDNQS